MSCNCGGYYSNLNTPVVTTQSYYTAAPSVYTAAPSVYTAAPVVNPSVYTSAPVVNPSVYTSAPVVNPSVYTSAPVVNPSVYTSAPNCNPLSGALYSTLNSVEQSYTLNPQITSIPGTNPVTLSNAPFISRSNYVPSFTVSTPDTEGFVTYYVRPTSTYYNTCK
jgi:hypothetical protein